MRTIVLSLICLFANLQNVAFGTSISTNGLNTCYSDGSGNAYCWGYNRDGGNGNGHFSTDLYPQIVLNEAGLAPLTDIYSISSGLPTCAITTNGLAYCWGEGIFGNGRPESSSNVPVGVRDPNDAGRLNNATSVSTGFYSDCVTTTDQHAYCWGNNVFGRLGTGRTDYSVILPSPVVDISGTGTLGLVTAISNGEKHSCALHRADLSSVTDILCWGSNTNGELGTGDVTSSPTPVVVKDVTGLSTLTSISSVSVGGANEHHFTCALTVSSEVLCWGDNSLHQLGNDSLLSSSIPTKVHDLTGHAPLTGVSAISAGGYHACAITSGQALCWGNNETGELGNHVWPDAPHPALVLNEDGTGPLTELVAISAGVDVTCALRRDSAIFCWGDNSYGQQGNGTRKSSSLPVRANFDGIFADSLD